MLFDAARRVGARTRGAGNTNAGNACSRQYCSARHHGGFLLSAILAVATPFTCAALTRDQIVGNPENTFKAVDSGQINGEFLDLRTLSLSWEVKDLVVPGNGGLDLIVSRSFAKGRRGTSLANWDLEVPRIQIQAAPYGRLRGNLNGAGVCNDPRPEEWIQLQTPPPGPQEWVSGNWYWAPMMLLMPGERPRQLIVRLATATQYPSDVKYVTTDNWIVRCVNSGASFEVTSPRGTVYLLDKFIDLQVGEFIYGLMPGMQVYGASLVRDVHGNTLTYTYAPFPNAPSRVGPLQSIVASDGRLVEFSYHAQSSAPSSEKLQSFTFNGRTWTFEYDRPGTPVNNFTWLKRVNLPEGLRWEYQNSGPSPLALHFWPGLSKVTMPSGASIDYAYQNPISGRGHFLRTRTVAGPGIATAQYTYTKTQTNDFETVTVVAPTRSELYTFYRGWYDYRDAFVYQPPRSPLLPGLLKSLALSDLSGNLTRTVEYEYADLPKIGDSGGVVFVADNQEKPVPIQVLRILERAPGLTYTTTYSSFDAYGLPRTVIEQGDATRQVDLTYFANVAPWIVGVLDSETIVGEGTIDRDFFANGLVRVLNRFGIAESYDYHSSGDLWHRSWVREGVTHSVTYTDYFRGLSRLEQHPLGVQYQRAVNPDGTVQWSKDPLQRTTSYEYDGLKRPTKITPPIHAVTTIVWPSPTQMVLTRGNYRRTVSTDSLWRTTEVQERDLLRAESIYVRSSYDSLGRLTFKSIPSFSASEPRGLAYTYDELDRKTRITNTADNSYSTVCYTCVEVSSKDPRLANAELIRHERLNESADYYTTTNRYRSFGNPDAKELMDIEQIYFVPANKQESPRFINTRMLRDRLGNLLSVTQGALTRDYQYYPNKLLWRLIDPETGTTEFTYDEVGNRKTSRVGASAVTTFGYDDLNRLRTIDYPATTPDVDQDYYADGKTRYVASGGSRWDYGYDDFGSLRTETLAIDGRTFVLQYEYDANDALSKVIYPSGTQVLTNPDAFGRATTLGSYASGLTYHPDGQLRNVTYGNGEVMTFLLDSRNYPDSLVVAKNSINRVSMGFDYDLRGNMTSIVDYVAPANNRQLRYDGVHRLTGADGPWGVGSMTYDDVGNIKTMALGSQALTYTYNAGTNLLASVSGVVSYSMQYDAYGNVRSNGLYSFTFNDASQLIGVPSVPGLNYRYDGNGKRVASSASGAQMYYVYNRAGLLMYSWDAAADKAAEYFHAGSKLIARRDFGAGINADYDNDGLPNHIELQVGLNVNNAGDAHTDLDGDGLSTLAEYQAGTELTIADSDGDAINDGYEVRFGLNPFANDAATDADGDGLTNLQESQLRTNPQKVDTDNDGITDDQDPRPNFNPAIIPIIEFILNN